jgi:hypothetical protein
VMLAEADDHGQTDTCKQGQGLQVRMNTEARCLQVLFRPVLASAATCFFQ